MLAFSAFAGSSRSQGFFAGQTYFRAANDQTRFAFFGFAALHPCSSAGTFYVRRCCMCAPGVCQIRACIVMVRRISVFQAFRPEHVETLVCVHGFVSAKLLREELFPRILCLCILFSRCFGARGIVSTTFLLNSLLLRRFRAGFVFATSLLEYFSYARLVCEDSFPQIIWKEFVAAKYCFVSSGHKWFNSAFFKRPVYNGWSNCSFKADVFIKEYFAPQLGGSVPPRLKNPMFVETQNAKPGNAANFVFKSLAPAYVFARESAGLSWKVLPSTG